MFNLKCKCTRTDKWGVFCIVRKFPGDELDVEDVTHDIAASHADAIGIPRIHPKDR